MAEAYIVATTKVVALHVDPDDHTSAIHANDMIIDAL